MKNLEQKMKCPECHQGEILFDAGQLIMGVQFSCPKCSVSIGLAVESMPVVQKTMDELNSVKRLAAK